MVNNNLVTSRAKADQNLLTMITEAQQSEVQQQQAEHARSLESIQRHIDKVYPPEQRRRFEEIQRQIDALYPPEQRQMMAEVSRSVENIVPPEAREIIQKHNEFVGANPAVAKAMAEAAEMVQKLPKGPIPSNIRIPR